MLFVKCCKVDSTRSGTRMASYRWYQKKTNQTMSGSGFTTTMQYNNAMKCWEYLNNNYSMDAVHVAGILGNFQHEGYINPAQFQIGGSMADDTTAGYGMPQFTPGSQYITLAGNKVNNASSNGRYQLDVIMNDTLNKWAGFGSMNEYLTTTSTPGDAAAYWLYKWERPADPTASEQTRRDSADYWYQEITGHTPPTPGSEFDLIPALESLKRQFFIHY